MGPSLALVSLFLFTLILAGCSSPKVQNRENEDAPSGSQAPARDRRPDFGQPERDPDVRGLVKSIVGNEATILKIDTGSMRNRASSTAEAVTGENTSQTSGVSLTMGAAPAGAPGGGRMMGGGPGGEASDEARTQMIERLKEMSTGEETIVIPVGIKMLKGSYNSDTKKMEMSEASLSDITAEKSVTVWLNQSVADRQVAEFVLIN